MFNLDSFMVHAIAITIIIILLACIIAIILYYKNKIRRFSKQLSDTLDMMIAEKTVDFQISNDTLISKLSYKLKRLYEILNERNKSISEERNNIQALIADISHQVKTPVANIKMYNSILTEREMTLEKQKEFLALTDAQIDKLEFLMNSLVKMSRLENGIIQLFPSENSVVTVISNAVCQILLKADKKNITVSVDCDEKVLALFDTKWTEEAIFNILDNAVKYTPSGGSINIKVEAMEIYAAIHIKDTGIGIAEDEQAKIFKRFFRSPNVHGTEGVGVGLFLAREIISRQQGFIKVTSEVGKGSCFGVYLMR